MASPDPPSSDSDVNIRFQRANAASSYPSRRSHKPLAAEHEDDDEEEEEEEEEEEGEVQSTDDDGDGRVGGGGGGGFGGYRDLLRSRHAPLGLDEALGLSDTDESTGRRHTGDSPPSVNHLEESEEYGLHSEDEDEEHRRGGRHRGSPMVVTATGTPQPPRSGGGVAGSSGMAGGGEKKTEGGDVATYGRVSASRFHRKDDEGPTTTTAAAGGKQQLVDGTTSRRRNSNEERKDSTRGSIAGGGGSLTDEIKELMAYIGRYQPQDVDLEPDLKPFIPDYIPAVGDIDAFIKIPRPDGKSDLLGLATVDEPSGKQSDPTVLDLQLRALSKSTSGSNVPSTVHSIPGEDLQDGGKGTARLDQWLKNVRSLHDSKPSQSVTFGRRLPDVEEVMQEWGSEMEGVWGELKPPSAELSLPLSTYARLLSVLLDIPVPPVDTPSSTGSGVRSNNNNNQRRGLVESLYVMFLVYAEFKNSQHFNRGEGWGTRREEGLDAAWGG